MKWVLVYIALTYHGHPEAIEIGRYDDMFECFYAREDLLVKLESYDGNFPVNTQAICIPHKSE